MSEDILKKPVHIALLRPTQLAKLAAAGKLEATAYGIDPHVVPQPLPVEQKERPYRVQIPKAPAYAKEAKKQIQLRVLHERAPAIPADKIPPCDTCKTAACCKVFLVNIEQLEYESGLYGDAAIKMTPEIFEQLQSRFILPQMMAGPRPSPGKTGYYLEGLIGEACPFLTEDNKCGIYDIRPQTCRVYTCVGDARITEEIRQGTVSIAPQDILSRTQDVNVTKPSTDK